MTVQVRQTFPHCERCGKLLHSRRPRIESRRSASTIAFCSELCRDEYQELFGLEEPGAWTTVGSEAGEGWR